MHINLVSAGGIVQNLQPGAIGQMTVSPTLPSKFIGQKRLIYFFAIQLKVVYCHFSIDYSSGNFEATLFLRTDLKS
jgi:hypothetical protein